MVDAEDQPRGSTSITGGDKIPITTTMPDELLRHNISDEELELLTQTRLGYLWEGQWVAFGLFLGSCPQIIEAIIKAYLLDEIADRVPLSFGNLTLTAISVGAFAVFITLFFVMRGRSAQAKDLKTIIRARSPCPTESI